LIFDQFDFGRRGVSRCTKETSSIDFLMPSIQPQHRQATTQPCQSMLGVPDFFLYMRTHSSVLVA
jgi:hypothetical protein